MSKPNTPSRAQAMRQALEQADGPLSFDQLLAATRKSLPMDAQSLKAGLNALRASYDPEARLIQSLEEDRYGWLPKLAIGAVLCHTLTKDELKKQLVTFEPEITTALWPAGIRFGNIESLKCQLPERSSLTLQVEMVGEKRWRATWGTRGEPAFWEWLRRQDARVEDALILRVEGGQIANCRVAFEPRTTRDEARIQERNTVLADAAFAFVKTHRRGVRLEDIAARLIAQGIYHDPCPPDSLEAVVNSDTRFRWEQDNLKATTRYDHLHHALGLAEPDIFDLLELQPKAPSRKRPSRKELAGQVYRFKAAFRFRKSLWRRIGIRGDQFLRELDREMRAAFGHDQSDHLSEFYLGVDADAHRRGLGHHNPFERGGADDWRIGELGLEPGDELLYTYDFGDNIQHLLRLEAVMTPEPGAKYPRIVEQNKPRYHYCESCQQKGRKEVATWICIECSNREQQEVLVCERHLAKDHEEHYAQEIVY
jgi:Plasmid pRiA4b ORF-3-like protein